MTWGHRPPDLKVSVGGTPKSSSSGMGKTIFVVSVVDVDESLQAFEDGNTVS